MSLVRIKNLTFAYDSSFDEIFQNVSFEIDTDWKLGFIGRNGRGKTTFLNLLLGKYEYSGSIHARVKFEYFPYAIKDKSKNTIDIFRDICPEAMDWEISYELNKLDVEDTVLSRPFQTLSNGEQTKVLLAALFLISNAFLLIDEPTNHLDTAGRDSIKNYLKKKKGFILVSHDRTLLDECVDHVLSINRADIEVQKGNFSSWHRNKKQQDHYELVQNEKLKKEMKRLSSAAQQSKQWSDCVESSKNGTRNSGIKPDKGYVGHKAAKMMKRSKNIEARKNSAIVEKSKLLKNIETVDSLALCPLDYHSPELLSLQNISIHYGAHAVCSHVSFSLKKGERIALQGKNGSGKTSILKLICGESIPFEGALQIPKGLRISYVSQDTSSLGGSLFAFAAEHKMDETQFLTILRKLDFSRTQFEKDIADFSSGQKKKVLLAKSLCEQAHLYIWDEPLNYIDVLSRIQIEELILEYQPTLIFVEHDLTFAEKIATKIVTL